MGVNTCVRAHTHVHTCTHRSYLHSHLPWHTKYSWLYFNTAGGSQGHTAGSRESGCHLGAWAVRLGFCPRTPCGLSGKEQALSTYSAPRPQPTSHTHDTPGVIPQTPWMPLLPGSLSISHSSLTEEPGLPPARSRALVGSLSPLIGVLVREEVWKGLPLLPPAPRWQLSFPGGPGFSSSGSLRLP